VTVDIFSLTTSSAVAKRSFKNHSRSYEFTPLSMACVSSY